MLEGTQPTGTAVTELLRAGGPVMWILAVLSVLALAIVIVKLFDFARFGVWRRRAALTALDELGKGERETALKRAANAPGPLADILATALRSRRGEGGDALAREEVARRGAAWLESLRTGLRPLELIGTLAPLLGLLGTTLGMIEAFRELEAAGNRVDPSVLSGGIWEALLTTAAGLSVAVPVIAAHVALERSLERLHHAMQDTATRVFTTDPGSSRTATPTDPQQTWQPAEAAGAD